MAKRSGRTQAGEADRYDLYQQSVQEPLVEVVFFDRVYGHAYGGKPRVLQEDFCGTFAVCCEWVRRGPDRVAYGVDLDPEPLEWGTRHNLRKLRPDQQTRIDLLQEDVRTSHRRNADVLAAQNFSFWIFKTRDALREYFRCAHRNLAPQGVIVLDMMGGADCLHENQTDKRKLKGFTYEWEQVRFDPISHDCRFHIHFQFRDGSRMSRAFSYDWRLWTIPEVRELLAEAGFSRSEVYWEGTDRKSNEGNGVYTRRAAAPPDDCWVSYVVGVK